MNRIILTVFLLSFLFATPSYANGIIYINGQEQTWEPVIVDGTTYVPLRSVAENLGAQVSNYDGNVHVSNDPDNDRLHRPEITGNEEFRDVMSKALNLLEEFDFPHYMMVCQNVKSITAISDDEASLIREKPLKYYEKRQVKINQSVFEAEGLFIPEIMASAVIHDCTHFVQYRYGYFETQNKVLTDVQAYMNEIMASSLSGAPLWYIDYVIEKLFNMHPDVYFGNQRQAYDI